MLASVHAHLQMKKIQTSFLLKDEEVTAERYNEMLGALPPERMVSNAFLVGEPTDHRGDNGEPRFQMFFRDSGKYYDGGLCTIKEFDTFLIPYFTREQYSRNEVTHEQYFAQFVTPRVISIVLHQFSVDELLASKDEHLNDLKLYRWDALHNSIVDACRDILKEADEWTTMAITVCIAKAAARQIIEAKRHA